VREVYARVIEKKRFTILSDVDRFYFLVCNLLQKFAAYNFEVFPLSSVMLLVGR